MVSFFGVGKRFLDISLAGVLLVLLFVPFIMIDLVVATVLMSMGMMMMPPVVISTPCKLLLFILVDGWSLTLRALSLSFET